MKYCMECGEKMADDQRFCPICGTKAPDAPVQPEESVTTATESGIEMNPEKKKNGKLGIILGICAGVLAIGAVILVLVLTGVIGKKAPKKEIVLEPSKEKLVQLEDESITDVYERAVSLSSTLKNTSFDAIVTLEVPSVNTGYYDISGILNNTELQIRSDVHKDKKNYGITLLMMQNTFFDLRLFDIGQNKISFYASSVPTVMYELSLDEFLTNLIDTQNAGGINIQSMLEFMLSDQAGEKQKEDYEAIKKAFLDTVLEGEVDIKEDETVKLFNGKEEIVCELYTVKPTKEQIESFLNRTLDIIEKGDGYIARIMSYAGMPASQLREARDQIPEIADSICESGLKFTVAIKGNDIVRQQIETNETAIIMDTRKTESGNKAMVSLKQSDDEITLIDYDEDAKGKCSIKVNADSDIFGTGFMISGTFDKKQKSVIGTCAGSFDIMIDSEKVATITIENTESGYMHTVTLDSDALDIGLDGDVKVHILVGPGTGVKRPNDMEIVDISKYSQKELYELIMKVFKPFVELAGTL